MSDNEFRRKIPEDDFEDFDIEKELNVFYGTPIEEILFTEDEIDEHYNEEAEEVDLTQFDVKKEEDAFLGEQESIDDIFGSYEDFSSGTDETDEPDFSGGSGLDDVLQAIPDNLDEDEEPEEVYPDMGMFQDEPEEAQESSSPIDLNDLIDPSYDEDDDESSENDFIPVDKEETPESEPESEPEPELPQEEEIPEEEDRDPIEGKDRDNLTQEEMKAHFDWVKRQRAKKLGSNIHRSSERPQPVVKEEPSKPEPESKAEQQEEDDDTPFKPAYAAERKKEDIIQVKDDSLKSKEDIPKTLEKTAPVPDKEPEPESRKRFDIRSAMQRHIRKTDSPSAKGRNAEDEDKTSAAIVSNIRSESSVREMFDRKKAAIILDDITLEIDKFLKNQKDITENALKDIQEEPAAAPIKQKEDSPVGLPQKDKPAAAETGQPSEETSVTIRKETSIAETASAEPDKPKEDKVTDEMSEIIDIQPVRSYSNGKAHVKKPNYGKAKEDEVDSRIGIAFFAAACFGVSLFVGLKANSYYNHVFINSKGKLKAGLGECIINGIISEDSLLIIPINEGIFFPVFLGLALILGFIGFMKFSDAKQRKESRVGHEHGNAHFGTAKDFVQFKAQFMDMSLSDEEAELRAEAKKNKKKK